MNGRGRESSIEVTTEQGKPGSWNEDFQNLRTSDRKRKGRRRARAAQIDRGWGAVNTE